MDADRRRVLIGLVVALAALRFLVVPWIESQGDARERLEVLTNRLDRSAGVVLNREAITASAASLEKANAADRPKFPQSANAESFRLEAQQRVTGLVEAAALRVEVFDWILDGPSDATALGFIRGRISLRGDMRTQALLFGTLEGELPNMIIREIQYSFEYPARGPFDNRATTTVVADFYFRREVGP